MTNILVLCTGNSCRSQMAHGYLTRFTKSNPDINIYSAGIETHGLNKNAVAIMKEDGIDITHHTSNHIDEYVTIDFNYIITVCDHANENCPFIPSKNAVRLHHNFSDPSRIEGTKEEIHQAFTTCREEIKAYCSSFVSEKIFPKKGFETRFNVEETIAILSQAPSVLIEYLRGVPKEWHHKNEGGDSWSPYDIIGHLVHGENTDWIPRLEIILGDKKNKTFTPYDRFAQFSLNNGKTIDDLLTEFDALRKKNINILQSKNITEAILQREGIHPELGPITLKNLLAAWMVHDQGHIGQIVRVVAKQYTNEVGSWTKYMTILNHSPKE